MPLLVVLWNSKVARFEGEEAKGLTTVVVSSQESPEAEAVEVSLPVDAAFVAIGHIPNTKIFKDQLDMDGEGPLLFSFLLCLPACLFVFFQNTKTPNT